MNALVPFPKQLVSLRHARSGFEAISKDLSRAELLRYFTYSEQDYNQIFQCRGEHNQIGFALLLSGVRLTGRFPGDFDFLPRRFLQHVCQQLNLHAQGFLSPKHTSARNSALLDYSSTQLTACEQVISLRALGTQFTHNPSGLVNRRSLLYCCGCSDSATD